MASLWEATARISKREDSGRHQEKLNGGLWNGRSGYYWCPKQIAEADWRLESTYLESDMVSRI